MSSTRKQPNRTKRMETATINGNRISHQCSFSSRLKSFEKVHMFNDEPISYQIHAPLTLIPADLRSKENGNLSIRSASPTEGSLQNNVVVQLYSPQWLAQMGFYYSPISMKHKFAITCSHCNMLIRDPVPAETDICKLHLSGNPSCALSLIWRFRNMKENTGATTWRKDQYFGIVDNSIGINIRKETFKTWKFEFPDIDKMVSSGLYYDPLNDKNENSGDDRVICMYCGLNLEQWEENDDPVEAHKLSNPDCWVFNYHDYNDVDVGIENDTTAVPTELAEDNNIPDFQPYENNPFSDIENDSNENELGVMHEIDKPHRHSIESTTTTTTTNVMPIEIVDKDEIEEYLSNSQQFSEKMVDIPSIKSSELSQYFTELDAGSENDLGASYFANNRRKREKEREEIEKIMSNVEPISEEVEISTVLSKDNQSDHIIQPIDSVQDENEDYENYQFDDFEAPEPDQDLGHVNNKEINVSDTQTEVEDKPTVDYENANSIAAELSSMEKQVEVNDSQHNISTSFLANASKVVELKTSGEEEKSEHEEIGGKNQEQASFVDESVQENNEANSHEQFEVISNISDKITQDKVSNDTDGKHQHQSKNAEDTDIQSKHEEDERQKEITRVEKLEAELNFLKEQIAALQKSQQKGANHDKVPEEITPISINESKFISEEVQVKLEKEIETETVLVKTEKKEVEKRKSKGKKKKKSKRKHDDENLLMRKNKKLKSVISEDSDKMDIDVNVAGINGFTTGGEEKDPEVKIEVVEHDERGLRYSSSSVIEPISLFRSDNDSAIEQTSDVKNISKQTSLKYNAQDNTNDETENQFVTPVQEHKDQQKADHYEGEGDVLITPQKYVNNSINQVPFSSPVKQPKKSLKVPTFSAPIIDKSINEVTDNSEIPTQADEFRDNKSEISLDKTIHQRPNNKDGNKSYHLYQASEQICSPNRVFDHEGTNDDDLDNTSPTLLRKNARSTPDEEDATDLRNLIKNELKNKASTSTGGKAKSGNNSPEKLFLGSDFMMDNQSTPHITKVENLSKDLKANYNATPKIPPPVLPEKSTEWQPINGKKYFEFLKDIQEATSYVKEVIDSPYELLGEDMDGLLTEFVAEIPPDQLQMTIRERLKFQEDLAVRLVLDKADEMIELFRKDQQQALQFLENLPEE